MFITIMSFYFTSCLLPPINIAEDIANNRNRLEEFSMKEVKESTSHIPGDRWFTTAIKDIGYFLRGHKFNEWDRRYYLEQPAQNLIGFFGTFPTPPLRSLHWEVKANCHNDFYRCINYLHSVVETAPYTRLEDTSILLNENITSLNEKTIKLFDRDCKEKHAYAQKIGLPFDDPVEKFQWRTTASYYMCWYTMLGIPALSMLGESCDNFASCLDSDFSNHNYDPRADDKFSFDCAIYTFCPDPCCPKKHIDSISKCQNENVNPCFVENTERLYFQRDCEMDRKINQNLKDIISNKWNVSCYCRDGFKWESKFGMCIDVNECLLENHQCDIISQNCLNLPGTFQCICKWGYELSKNEKKCEKRNTILKS